MVEKIIRSLLVAVVASIAAKAQEPLPFLHKGDVVLFQGDSITDGGRQRTGNDYNHIMGQDYAYLLAATIGYNSPERNLVFVNRGNGGETVVDLTARWDTDTIAINPALLSILIGVNDTLSEKKAYSLAKYEETYDALLARTVAALPKTRIILGEPFVLPVGKRVATYASDLAEVKKRQEVVERLGAKYHLPVIHYQRAFDEACKKAPADHWSWDGVHPTYAGHGLMAAEWLKVANSAWSGK